MPNFVRGPEYGVPQRAIAWANLYSCHGVQLSVYCTRELANRRPRLMG